MSFNDIFKSSFLENVSEFSILDTVLGLAAALVIGLFIFMVYKKTLTGVLYSSGFALTLVGLALVTTLVIMAVTSNVVLSLGMVGALSIVRFRTAVKEPMDLVFLFWSISVGIICGAGLFEIAIFSSLLITAAIMALDHFPSTKSPMILVIDSSDIDGEEQIMETVEKYSAHSKVKSRGMNAESLNLVIEVRIKDGAECIREINRLNGVRNVSMVSQEGEVTF